jgi:hypothetical protein
LTSISKINNPAPSAPRILISPLDWGLGHATRCIPIIKELLTLKCEVIIAASGDQKALLEQEFPSLSFVGLPGYGVKYGKNRAFTVGKIMFFLPKILIRIKKENTWLKAFIRLERPDAIISDNRYGLHHRGVFSVFITHQLHIKTPFGKWADRWLQRLNYRAIGRFSACWVPDWDAADAGDAGDAGRAVQMIPLAGELSHPQVLPSIPLRYIGPLSRFSPPTGPQAGSPTGVPANRPATPPTNSAFSDLLVLLSGPEPQRSIFEKRILQELRPFKGRAILVRGLPQGKAAGVSDADGLPPVLPPDLHIYNHLPAAELNHVLCGAALVLSRPGYSSVMDLFRMGKKCIFIPTPGQTEQEYLGAYLSGKQLALTVNQRDFHLADALKQAAAFPFKSLSVEGSGNPGEDSPLRAAVVELVGKL